MILHLPPTYNSVWTHYPRVLKKWNLWITDQESSIKMAREWKSCWAGVWEVEIPLGEVEAQGQESYEKGGQTTGIRYPHNEPHQEELHPLPSMLMSSTKVTRMKPEKSYATIIYWISHFLYNKIQRLSIHTVLYDSEDVFRGKRKVPTCLHWGLELSWPGDHSGSWKLVSPGREAGSTCGTGNG